jgi:hypothetical protein
MPLRAATQSKPAALSMNSLASGAGEAGRSDAVPATGQASRDVSSAFNQMVAQIVAESAAPEAVPMPASPAPAAPAQTVAQTVKMPPKSTAAVADQFPDLPAPASTAPVALRYTVSPPAVSTVGRRQDTSVTPSVNNNAAQPPVVPVDVNVPIPIAPKSHLQSTAGGGDSTDGEPVKTAAVSNAEEPAAITLQPKPVLEVKIHLNQPLTGTSFIPTETISSHQSSVANPVASPVASQVADPYPARSIVANPLVVTIGSLPASPPPTVIAPVVAAPVVAPALVATPAVIAPVVQTVVPMVAAPVVAATSAPALVPIDAPLTVYGAQEPAAKQQDSERGAPDPEDADTGPVISTPHAASRTTGNQETSLTARQDKLDAGSTQPPVHNATALTGTAPMGAAPVTPIAATAPMTTTEAKPETQAGSASLREESMTGQTKTQQPIRSLALEFTPDGAGDIKVRLSERGGDVHISLHGTDPSLAGRVREGVDDLVGSLSRAGYDAEAWTPGQGRQNQREESDQRKPPRATSGGTDAEEFSGILQQPLQEIS